VKETTAYPQRKKSMKNEAEIAWLLSLPNFNKLDFIIITKQELISEFYNAY